METNIDDCSGEILGHTMQLLLNEGALDVYFTPIQMKKNRPAVTLSVICKKEDLEQLQNIIFMQTTTIGIRYYDVSRRILPRQIKEIELPIGKVLVKEVKIGEMIKQYPEYESVKLLAKETGISVQEIYQMVRGR